MSIRKIAFTALLAVAGMAMSSASMAQFDGFYIGGGFTRFKAFETAVFFPPDITATLSSDDHQGGYNGFVGYAFTFGNLLNIGLEGSASNHLGRITVRNSVGDSDSHSLEEGVALSILPGLKLGPSALIYGRIGAAQAKLKGQNVSFSETHKGKLYGIGMKGAVHKNLCLVVEYQNYDLKEKNGLKPEGVGVLLGAQYTF